MKSIIWKTINILQMPQAALLCFRAPRILLYHGATERENFFGIENYRQKHIPQEALRQQLQFIQSHFRVVPLKDLVTAWAFSPREARGMIAITFDDGYQNIFRVAWPIFKEYNLPFTIFLPADFIEQREPLWVDQLEYAINYSKKDEFKIMKNGNFSFPIVTKEEKICADAVIRRYAKLIPDKKRKELV